MLGVDKGIPARRSVRQDGEKKGSVDRSEGLLGGAPRSGGNSPESFQTGVATGSQSRTVGEKGKGAVQSHSEEGGGSSERERVAQKRDRGPEGSLTGVGAEEGHLAFGRVQKKLPLQRPSLESPKGSLQSGSCSGKRGRGRPNSKIVRVKGKADGGRETRRQVVDEEVEEDRTEDRSLRYPTAYPEGITRGVPQSYPSTAVREKRLGPANKARGQARGQKLVKESRMPDRVKGTGKINGGQDGSLRRL